MTSTDLALAAESSPALRSLVAEAAEVAKDALALNTRRAYRSDWAGFAAFCNASGVSSLPAAPGTVVAYLASRIRQGHAPASLGRALVSISQGHKSQGHPSPVGPEARATLAGLTKRPPKQRQAAAATTDVVRGWVTGLGTDLRGLRDRALVLLGYAGALRRSELVGLEVADLTWEAGGVYLEIRRSKTGQRRVPIHEGLNPELCPVRALRAWLEAAAISTGPVFRAVSMDGAVGTEALRDVEVDRLVKRLGGVGYSGHSLRCGHITEAHRAGVPMAEWMATSGHRSVKVALGYVRRAMTLQSTDSSARLGL